MTTYTHAQLVAAVEAARGSEWDDVGPYKWWARERDAHLDTLAAVLVEHPEGFIGGGRACLRCDYYWPCPTIAIVVDALTRMGALSADECDHPNDVQAEDYSWKCPDCGRYIP